MPAALVTERLSKSFGMTRALDSLDLTVPAGEIHALVGHNGSGKSTLVKILSGYHRPDSGRALLGGLPVSWPMSTGELRELGVSFLHQDIGLVGTASVLENLRVARFTTGAIGQIRWRHEREVVRGMLASFGLRVDPDRPVGSLSAAERTVVGLLRAFQDVEHRESGLLVLDEATASLPAKEVDLVLDTIRAVAAHGIAVLFVTHHLNEPLAVAQRVSALRDGKLVGTVAVGDVTEADLAEMVLGTRRAAAVAAARPPAGESAPTPKPSGRTVLQVKHLRGPVVDGVDFEVRAGEILGLTGLLGSGHQELPYLLYGATRTTGGSVIVNGHELEHLNPSLSMGRGIGFVSGDRANAGGVPNASLSENLTVPVVGNLAGRTGWIRRIRESRLVETLVGRFQIVPSDPSLNFAKFSGGNQQKALVGRWMSSPRDLLLLDEPTAGVDIGAVDQILATLQEFARAGGAVVMASNQYEDLERICDRVFVFWDGRIVQEVVGSDINASTLLTLAEGSASAQR